MKIIILFVAIALIICISLGAEIIHLKNGDIITGTIVETTEDLAVVETEQGKLEIKKEDILKIEYSESNENPIPIIRNSAFILHPISTIRHALNGDISVVVEGQTAFTKNFAITVIAKTGTLDDFFVFAGRIGPLFRLTGSYLDGLFFGVYSGLGYITDWYNMVWQFTISADFGYQQISDSGFLWGIKIGGMSILIPVLSVPGFDWSLYFGFSFEDPWIKPR